MNEETVKALAEYFTPLWETCKQIVEDLTDTITSLVGNFEEIFEQIASMIADLELVEPRRRPKRPCRYEKQELYFRRSQPVRELVRTHRFHCRR